MKKKKMLTLILSAAMAVTAIVPMTANAKQIVTCTHENAVWVDEEAATCSKPGVRGHYECQDCWDTAGLIDQWGNVYDDFADFYFTLESGGHTKGDSAWQNYQAPTCVNGGYEEIWKCVDCGAYFNDEHPEGTAEVTGDYIIPATGIHTAGDLFSAFKAPTCNAIGYEEVHKCATCDALISEKHPEGGIWPTDFEIPATGIHTEGDLFNGFRAPTCDTVGYEEVHKCATCDALISEKHPEGGIWPTDFEIPALGHDLEHFDAVPATCTTPGFKEHSVCKTCGAWFNKNGVKKPESNLTIPATDHEQKNKAVPAVEPTCTTDGHIKYWECKNCDAYLNKNGKELKPSKVIIPATGHQNIQHLRAVEPTCVKNGRIECDKCKDCGTFLDKDGNTLDRKDVIIPADAKYHNYKNGVCTICGNDVRTITVIFKDKRGTRLTYTLNKGESCKVPGVRDIYQNPSKNTWKCSDAKLTVKKNAYVDFEDLTFAAFDKNGNATVTFVGNYKYK